MVLIICMLNTVISAWNSYACGRMWNDARAKGGFASLLVWSGIIMAACGFTSVVGIGLASIATHIPMTLLVADEKAAEVAGQMLLDPAGYKAMLEMLYLTIVFPVLGSGLVITVQSWRAAAKRGYMGDYAAAGWNTFATVHNTYNAVSAVPSASKSLSAFFDGENASQKVVIALVAVAALSSLLLTYAFFDWGRTSEARERRLAAA